MFPRAAGIELQYCGILQREPVPSCVLMSPDGREEKKEHKVTFQKNPTYFKKWEKRECKREELHCKHISAVSGVQ